MTTTQHDRLAAALTHADSSARLQTALTAGTYPDPAQVPVLVARCAVEPDFPVRDMLTWAITRHAARTSLPLLLAELGSPTAQARSQALHTLSKLGEPATWAAITPALLHDAEAEVARAAWRAAVVLVPAAEERMLVAELVRELGRGDLEVQRSLSRALVELGDAAVPALATASTVADERVRAHATATEALLRDPDSGFAGHLEEAKRAVIRRDAPVLASANEAGAARPQPAAGED